MSFSPSRVSLFAGDINNFFHNGAPIWKPGHPAIIDALSHILASDKGFIRKLDRMLTNNMKDSHRRSDQVPCT